MRILIFDNSAIIKKDRDFCIEMRTGEFAKELQTLGNDVVFYGQIIENIENTTDIYPLLKNGLQVKGTKRLNNKLWSYLKLYAKALPEILKADFVYMFYPSALRFLLPFVILFNKKFGLYIRGIDDLKSRESRFFYKKASTIFTVADYFTGYVNEISPKKVGSTIRPMIIFDENDLIVPKAFTQNPAVLKVLYLGRMTNDKGVIELLEATKILLENSVKIYVDLVGSGEYLEELKDLALQLNISDHVHFHGPVFEKEKIRGFYSAADLYVLPTYHEGFPRTLYEAMICGTPIMTTFVGGIPGLMEDRVNCVEIKPKSVEDLVNDLIFAQENYNEMINFAENAQETIKNILQKRKNSHAQSVNIAIQNL